MVLCATVHQRAGKNEYRREKSLWQWFFEIPEGKTPKKNPRFKINVLSRKTGRVFGDAIIGHSRWQKKGKRTQAFKVRLPVAEL